jgi:hypothetical protein
MATTSMDYENANGDRFDGKPDCNFPNSDRLRASPPATIADAIIRTKQEQC